GGIGCCNLQVSIAGHHRGGELGGGHRNSVGPFVTLHLHPKVVLTHRNSDQLTGPDRHGGQTGRSDSRKFAHVGGKGSFHGHEAKGALFFRRHRVKSKGWR